MPELLFLVTFVLAICVASCISSSISFSGLLCTVLNAAGVVVLALPAVAPGLLPLASPNVEDDAATTAPTACRTTKVGSTNSNTFATRYGPPVMPDTCTAPERILVASPRHCESHGWTAKMWLQPNGLPQEVPDVITHQRRRCTLQHRLIHQNFSSEAPSPHAAEPRPSTWQRTAPAASCSHLRLHHRPLRSSVARLQPRRQTRAPASAASSRSGMSRPRRAVAARPAVPHPRVRERPEHGEGRGPGGGGRAAAVAPWTVAVVVTPWQAAAADRRRPRRLQAPVATRWCPSAAPDSGLLHGGGGGVWGMG